LGQKRSCGLASSTHGSSPTQPGSSHYRPAVQAVYCIGPQAHLWVCEFHAQELANRARAFALMGQLNNQLFSALAQKQSYGSASAAHRGSPTQPGPFALLGQLANKLFTALAIQRICRWAISSHGGPPTQSGHSQRWARSTTMLTALAHYSQLRVGELNAQELANTAWAFAHWGQLELASSARSSQLTAGGRVHSRNSRP